MLLFLLLQLFIAAVVHASAIVHVSQAEAKVTILNIYIFAAVKHSTMIKRLLLKTTLLLLPFAGFSQTESDELKITFSGFVRADAMFDTRQTVEAREGYMLFYPKKPLFDAQGNDINAKPSFNQYSMTSRAAARIEGHSVFGAKTFAYLETDFTGASNAENNSLRLRHSYINFQWKKTRLIVGQYWHPLDLPEMIPYVMGLNTGAPFHAFSRHPQVRVDYQIGDIKLIAVAASQRDFANTGPQGASYEYLRNSIIPNLHAQIHYQKPDLLAGAGVDYKKLTPRLRTDSNLVSKESLNCFSFTVFAKKQIGGTSVKAQYTLNRALNDHCMLGGYGVTHIDTLTDRREYEPLNSHSAWLNFHYNAGKKWQPSVYFGYACYRIPEGKFTGPVYARDADLEYVYRIAPMLTYIYGRMQFYTELEYTSAAWKLDARSLILSKDQETGMFRFAIGTSYYF